MKLRARKWRGEQVRQHEVTGAVIDALEEGALARTRLARVRAGLREMDCSADRDLVLVALGEEQVTPASSGTALLPFGGDECGDLSTPTEVICVALGHDPHLIWPCLDAVTIVSELEDNGWVIVPDADGSEDARAATLRAAADEWDRINAGPDFSELKAIAQLYSPGMAITSIWLRQWADSLDGGGEMPGQGTLDVEPPA